MRRPSHGTRIMRGLLLIWKKMKMNISMGYVPYEWTPQDRKDVNHAVRYIGAMVDWYENRETEGDDAAT
jgi:hypothetical protein